MIHFYWNFFLGILTLRNSGGGCEVNLKILSVTSISIVLSLFFSAAVFSADSSISSPEQEAADYFLTKEEVFEVDKSSVEGKQLLQSIDKTLSEMGTIVYMKEGTLYLVESFETWEDAQNSGLCVNYSVCVDGKELYTSEMEVFGAYRVDKKKEGFIAFFCESVD